MRKAMLFISLLCLALLLGGCTGERGTEWSQTFTLAEVQSIEADYDGELVTVTTGDFAEITLTETLSRDKDDYRARLQVVNGVLTITEGTRPVGSGVRAALELSLPASYRGDLSVHTTEGNIAAKEISCGTAHLESTGDGSLDLSLRKDCGGLTAYAKNGEITLTVPEALGLELTAEAKNGKVTNFLAAQSVHDGVPVLLEARNGDITVQPATTG